MTDQGGGPGDIPRQGATIQRRIILVTGMHRSGTSAVTRALNLCGASVPGDLLEATSANPDGFWESRQVTLLHDELLNSIGFTWDDIREFPAGWFDTVSASQYRARLWAAVESDVATRSPLLLKDPRLCRLVPLWLRIAQEHDVKLSFVIPLRHPLDVADSLARRDHMPQTKALLLWLRHFLETEHATRSGQRCFVSYERLMRDGVTTISAIARALELTERPLTAEIAEQVESFLNESLWHHRHALDEPAPTWVKRVYAWNLAAERGDNPDPAMLDVISDGLRAAEAIYWPLIELIGLRDARIAEFERQLMDRDTTIRKLETERQALYDERHTLHDERQTLYDERQALYNERSTLYGERSKSFDERHALYDEQGALRDERHKLQEERHALHDEQGALRGERDKLQEERHALYEEQRALRDERTRLHEDQRDLFAARDNMAQALSQAEQAMQVITTSTSWRVTAPLRSIGRLVHRPSRQD